MLLFTVRVSHALSTLPMPLCQPAVVSHGDTVEKRRLLQSRLRPLTVRAPASGGVWSKNQTPPHAHPNPCYNALRPLLLGVTQALGRTVAYGYPSSDPKLRGQPSAKEVPLSTVVHYSLRQHAGDIVSGYKPSQCCAVSADGIQQGAYRQHTGGGGHAGDMPCKAELCPVCPHQQDHCP